MSSIAFQKKVQSIVFRREIFLVSHPALLTPEGVTLNLNLFLKSKMEMGLTSDFKFSQSSAIRPNTLIPSYFRELQTMTIYVARCLQTTPASNMARVNLLVMGVLLIHSLFWEIYPAKVLAQTPPKSFVKLDVTHPTPTNLDFEAESNSLIPTLIPK